MTIPGTRGRMQPRKAADLLREIARMPTDPDELAAVTRGLDAGL